MAQSKNDQKYCYFTQVTVVSTDPSVGEKLVQFAKAMKCASLTAVSKTYKKVNLDDETIIRNLSIGDTL